MYQTLHVFATVVVAAAAAAVKTKRYISFFFSPTLFGFAEFFPTHIRLATKRSAYIYVYFKKDMYSTRVAQNLTHFWATRVTINT